MATGLNADRVDGLDATQIVSQARAKEGLTAENADKVGGLTATELRNAEQLGGTSADTIKSEMQPFSFRLADGGSRTIGTSGPLTLRATCEIDEGGTDMARFLLTTSADNSTAFDNGAGPDADFDTGETADVGLNAATGNGRIRAGRRDPGHRARRLEPAHGRRGVGRRQRPRQRRQLLLRWRGHRDRHDLLSARRVTGRQPEREQRAAVPGLRDAAR